MEEVAFMDGNLSLSGNALLQCIRTLDNAFLPQTRKNDIMDRKKDK
jgi:hypothetical protein